MAKKRGEPVDEIPWDSNGVANNQDAWVRADRLTIDTARANYGCGSCTACVD